MKSLVVLDDTIEVFGGGGRAGEGGEEEGGWG